MKVLNSWNAMRYAYARADASRGLGADTATDLPLISATRTACTESDQYSHI
jgi:hypothetical protein